MIVDNTKCECGHQNPVGTLLCEHCGKPLEEGGGDAPLEMRYDGAARRSRKADPGPLDLAWRFFSSVKVAVLIILLMACLIAVGTFLEQEAFVGSDPETFYREKYGAFGKWAYTLGLTDMYGSWWFKLLAFMLGASLIICSLDRVVPLYRALSRQQVRKHPQFLLRQKVVYRGDLASLGRAPAGQAGPAFLDAFADVLAKRRYRVAKEEDALLAEKNRFSRWGPYINHIGLIILLAGLLMRGIPGWHMDQIVGFPEGVPTPIPDTPYWLLNERFSVELYPEEDVPARLRERGMVVPKRFETEAVLYRCLANCDMPGQEPVLEEVHRHGIEVNKPLKHDGLLAYQVDFRETPQIRRLRVWLTEKATGNRYGPIGLDTLNPKDTYEAGPYRLELRAYYADFDLDENGLPYTRSRVPQAPAFVFLIKGPGLPEDGEVFMYFARDADKERFRQDVLNGRLAGLLDIGALSMEDVEVSRFTSYLNIRIDRALPVILAGALIFIAGVAMGIYWQHRRIWVRIEGTGLVVAAHTNKNWHGLRRELAEALGKAGIAVDPKLLDNRGNQA